MSALRLPPLSALNAVPPVDSTAIPMDPSHAYVGWSTYASAEDAAKTARTLIDERLAACAQVDGPIRSFYRQEGLTRESVEWRLTVKFTHENLDALSRRIRETHPYVTAQWIAVRADHASAEYLAWMNGY